MRLIDADELSKWISGQSKSPSCPKNESAFGLRIMKHIDRMPSAQPEPLWGKTVEVRRPLADREIVSRLRDIQNQVMVIEAIEAVQAQPSVQPDIIACGDCKHYIHLSQEEAIAILSDMKIDIPVPKAAVTQRKRNVALDMAISALSCSEIPNSSDSISRQAAIDAMTATLWHYPTEYLLKNINEYEFAKGLAELGLKSVPSVQPEERTEERTETHGVCLDVIDRQAAISYAISGRIRTLPTSEDGENWIRTSEVRQSLLTMPSAQPERTEKHTETHACDCISRQGAIDDLHGRDPSQIWDTADIEVWVNALPSVQPERKKDTIQKFHDYQIEWLKSHYDIELEPQLEEMIIRFLHDTANCYMMEIGRGEGEQE